ncbi:hypothetical protein QOT17_011167 [Balamuthia mandrillaris]
MGRESRWTGGCAPWFVVALALSYLCLCPLCPLSEAVAQDDAEYIWLEYEYREDGELEVEPELRFRHTAKEEEGEDDEEAEQPPMWPSSFIAMGYADDWNGSSIIYYDWPNRMMRRDSLLSWPPSYWKPSRTSAGESEAHPLTQPVFTSLIWKKVHSPRTGPPLRSLSKGNKWMEPVAMHKVTSPEQRAASGLDAQHAARPASRHTPGWPPSLLRALQLQAGGAVEPSQQRRSLGWRRVQHVLLSDQRV